MSESGIILSEGLIQQKTHCSTISKVEKVNLWGLDIEDISIAQRMKCLKVISLTFNRVKDLSPLQHCPELQELYLRKNNISSFSQLKYLQDLPNFRVIWLSDNPCTSQGDYRLKVLQILPNLYKIDEKEVTPEERQLAADNTGVIDSMETPKPRNKSRQAGGDGVNQEKMNRLSKNGVNILGAQRGSNRLPLSSSNSTNQDDDQIDLDKYSSLQPERPSKKVNKWKSKGKNTKNNNPLRRQHTTDPSQDQIDHLKYDDPLVIKKSSSNQSGESGKQFKRSKTDLNSMRVLGVNKQKPKDYFDSIRTRIPKKNLSEYSFQLRGALVLLEGLDRKELKYLYKNI